jgi:hypothetical protein
VFDSKFDIETNYCEAVCGFPHFLKANLEVIPQIASGVPPSISFSIHYSLFTLSFDAIHANALINLSIYLSIYLFYSCCSHLERRPSVKRFVSLQFLHLRQLIGLLGWGISPTQGRYHRSRQNKPTHRHLCLERAKIFDALECAATVTTATSIATATTNISATCPVNMRSSGTHMDKVRKKICISYRCLLCQT